MEEERKRARIVEIRLVNVRILMTGREMCEGPLTAPKTLALKMSMFGAVCNTCFECVFFWPKNIFFCRTQCFRATEKKIIQQRRQAVLGLTG